MWQFLFQDFGGVAQAVTLVHGLVTARVKYAYVRDFKWLCLLRYPINMA